MKRAVTRTPAGGLRRHGGGVATASAVGAAVGVLALTAVSAGISAIRARVPAHVPGEVPASAPVSVSASASAPGPSASSPNRPVSARPPVPAHPGHGGGDLVAWARLLRVSAALTVPGDALAGAAAAGRGANRHTLLAACASLCLYEAGMALNDWADRDIDAVERPDRPLPSGRITPGAALTAATGLTVAGLGFAAASGRRALVTAGALAGTVWAYDLRLKHTPAGPAAMASARALDLLLGAVATAGRGAPAGTLPTTAAARQPPHAKVFAAAGLLGAHTFAVTSVSRHEAEGGSSRAPLAALAATAAVAGASVGTASRRSRVTEAFGALYALSAARPFLHAALNPSPPLLQQAVGGGIRATVPLQAALAARAGSPYTAVPLLALLPLARRLSGKVSPT